MISYTLKELMLLYLFIICCFNGYVTEGDATTARSSRLQTQSIFPLSWILPKTRVVAALRSPLTFSNL
jgi:hypothetical protein